MTRVCVCVFSLCFQGLIKIRGDKCWRDLTCMDYHYEVLAEFHWLSLIFLYCYRSCQCGLNLYSGIDLSVIDFTYCLFDTLVKLLHNTCSL